MKIDTPKVEDVIQVAKNMRARDLKEFLAVSFENDVEGLANSLAARFQPTIHTLIGAYLDDGEPVAIGAPIMSRPNAVSLMFFATDKFPQIAIPLTRFLRRRLFPELRNIGIHRIEAVTLANYYNSRRWLGILGIQYEALLKSYGKGGEDFAMHAWVKDARQTRSRG